MIGYEGKYSVTEDGKVWSYKTNRFLKPFLTKRGYEVVDFMVKRKRQKFLVHRAVAITFIPNPCNKEQVNHKDGNRLNNRLENLEWCTNQENRDHALKYGLWDLRGEKNYQKKLSWKKVKDIRTRYLKGDISLRKLEIEYGVCAQMIHDVIQNRAWKL